MFGHFFSSRVLHIEDGMQEYDVWTLDGHTLPVSLGS